MDAGSQLDMQDATTVWNAHEFCEIVSSCGECSGGFVTGFIPSMVANAVRGHGHFGSSDIDQTVRCFSALPKVTSFCVTFLRSCEPDQGPQGVECRFVQGILETDFDGSSSPPRGGLLRASTAEDGEAESFGAAAEEGTHHSGEVNESVVCPRWFVAIARKPREGKAEAISPEPIRVSQDGVSGARRFNGEISVGGSFAEGQEGGEVDTRERGSILVCTRGFQRGSTCAKWILLKCCRENPGSRTNWPKGTPTFGGLARRGIRDSSRTSSFSACQRRSGATPSGGCKVEDGEGR